jgi:hypothetical protein
MRVDQGSGVGAALTARPARGAPRPQGVQRDARLARHRDGQDLGRRRRRARHDGVHRAGVLPRGEGDVYAFVDVEVRSFNSILPNGDVELKLLLCF